MAKPSIYFRGEVAMTVLGKEIVLAKPTTQHLYLLRSKNTSHLMSLKGGELERFFEQYNVLAEFKEMVANPFSCIEKVYLNDIAIRYKTGMEFYFQFGIVFKENSLGIEDTFTIEDIEVEVVRAANGTAFKSEVEAVKQKMETAFKNEQYEVNLQ